jgi:phosphotransferase system enzyme I (PtsI)
MIRHVSEAASHKNIEVFICGEMAGDPYHVPILLGLGMDELSMNPQSIPAVKQMIRSISMSDAKLFTEEVLKQPAIKDVAEMVRQSFGSALVDSVYTG